MPISTQIENKFIYWSLIFLSLGLFVSPTIVSLYHILIIIPALFLIKKGFKIKLEKSSICLLILFAWTLLSTVVNHGELIKPFKAYQDIKYYVFGVLCIFPLKSFLDHATEKQIKTLCHIFFATLIIGFFLLK